jgi:hypothetical protein
MSKWLFSDDCHDPCALCVSWDQPEDDPLGEKARPIWPDGRTVERIYRFTHKECTDSAIAYSIEAAGL